MKFLKTTQQLYSLNVDNIPVYSNSIECFNSVNVKVLKLSHFIIKDKDDFIKIINLFKKFKDITELSMLNIIYIKDKI